MKKLLQHLFQSTKKKKLTTEDRDKLRRKNLARDVAKSLLKEVHDGGLAHLTEILLIAIEDDVTRLALMHFPATRFAVGTAIIATLEHYGSVGSKRKKKGVRNCILTEDDENKLLEALRILLPTGSGSISMQSHSSWKSGNSAHKKGRSSTRSNRYTRWREMYSRAIFFRHTTTAPLWYATPQV